MSWLGLLKKNHSWFSPKGLATLCTSEASQAAAVSSEAAPPLPKEPLVRGSLVMETGVSPYIRPQMLLGITTLSEGGFRLSLQAVPGGGIILVIHRHGKTCHAAVNLDTGGRADTLRLTYAWDLSAGVARFTVEQPSTLRVAQRVLKTPVGLSLQDMHSCLTQDTMRLASADLSYVAASNQIEPIGPMPSLSPNTPVMTNQGYRPVGTLRRGDVVQTSSGDLVPVLANVRRTVPAAGLFSPIQLRAPFFGLQEDVVTSATQRLVIGGSRVEYMFGCEHVLVPAGHLKHGNATKSASTHPLTTYCQLLLPEHEAILAAGTFLGSLDIGRMRRRREILQASLLSRAPRAKLPEHARTAYPVLREF